MAVMADIQIRDEGSIILIIGATPEGQAWMDEHLPEDAPTFSGAVAAEPRYVPDIIDGAMEDGLTVGPDSGGVYAKAD